MASPFAGGPPIEGPHRRWRNPVSPVPAGGSTRTRCRSPAVVGRTESLRAPRTRSGDGAAPEQVYVGGRAVGRDRMAAPGQLCVEGGGEAGLEEQQILGVGQPGRARQPAGSVDRGLRAGTVVDDGPQHLEVGLDLAPAAGGGPHQPPAVLGDVVADQGVQRASRPARSSGPAEEGRLLGQPIVENDPGARHHYSRPELVEEAVDESHHQAPVVDNRQAGRVGARGPGRSRGSSRGRQSRPALRVDHRAPAVERVLAEDRHHVGRLLPAGQPGPGPRRRHACSAPSSRSGRPRPSMRRPLQALVEQQLLQEHPAHRHRRRHRHLGGAVADREGRLEVGAVLQARSSAEIRPPSRSSVSTTASRPGGPRRTPTAHRPRSRAASGPEPEAGSARRRPSRCRRRTPSHERIVGASDRDPDPVESPDVKAASRANPSSASAAAGSTREAKGPGPVALPQPPPGVHQTRNRDRQRAVAGQGATRDRGGGQGPGHRAGAVERLDAAVGPETSAKPSPPRPHQGSSRTHCTAEAAMAASTAFPPDASTAAPTSAASRQPALIAAGREHPGQTTATASTSMSISGFFRRATNTDERAGRGSGKCFTHCSLRGPVGVPSLR